MGTLTDQRIADCDSHVTESPDLWTSRVPAKYRDHVPVVDPHPASGVARWHVGDIWMYPVASTSQVGWPEYPPSFPLRWEDIDPGSHDPVARLARLDELGIQAQTLYPNIIAFATGVFMGMEREVGLACVPRLQRLPLRLCQRRPEPSHPDRHGSVLGRRGLCS